MRAEHYFAVASENSGVTQRFVRFLRGRRRLRGEGGTERVRVNLERFGLIGEGTSKGFRRFRQRRSLLKMCHAWCILGLRALRACVIILVIGYSRGLNRRKGQSRTVQAVKAKEREYVT